jgi:hypothetical protein
MNNKYYTTNLPEQVFFTDWSKKTYNELLARTGNPSGYTERDHQLWVAGKTRELRAYENVFDIGEQEYDFYADPADRDTIVSLREGMDRLIKLIEPIPPKKPEPTLSREEVEELAKKVDQLDISRDPPRKSAVARIGDQHSSHTHPVPFFGASFQNKTRALLRTITVNKSLMQRRSGSKRVSEQEIDAMETFTAQALRESSKKRSLHQAQHTLDTIGVLTDRLAKIAKNETATASQYDRLTRIAITLRSIASMHDAVHNN